MDIVIKVGGAFLEKNQDFSWMDDVGKLQAEGHRVIIVHGGGSAISRALKQEGVESTFIDGQRVTKQTEMQVIDRVLSSEVNLELVHKLQERGIRALGLSGADSKILLCEDFDPKLGQVGKVTQVDTQAFDEMTGNPVIVLSPVGIKHHSHIKMNVNADVAATAVAKALSNSKLVFLTGEDGVLDTKGLVMAKIAAKQIKNLIKDKVVTGGMIVKLQMIEDALKNCSQVAILSARKQAVISRFILSGECEGTVIS